MSKYSQVLLEETGIIIKTPGQIEGIRRACRIVAQTLHYIGEIIRPGITTGELEREAVSFFENLGAESACFGYRSSNGGPVYPAHICISVDDEVVHGIPGERKIRPENLVSVDVVLMYKGYIGDGSATFVMPDAPYEARKLAWVTYRARSEGIAAVRNGGSVMDISRKIQRFVESNGFSVVRDLVGHGVGIRMHEPPQIPNFVDFSMDAPLVSGMTVAIEPMTCAGGWEVFFGSDGWTVKTKDRSLSAHFEHTVLVTDDGSEILTLLPDGTEPYVPPDVGLT